MCIFASFAQKIFLFLGAGLRSGSLGVLLYWGVLELLFEKAGAGVVVGGVATMSRLRLSKPLRFGARLIVCVDVNLQ